MNVIEAIRTKRAVRRYRDEPLPDAAGAAARTRLVPCVRLPAFSPHPPPRLDPSPDQRTMASGH